jgi:hypothetical protein
LSTAINMGRYGLDAFGNPIRNPDGSKPTQMDLNLLAAYSIVEPLVPFASASRRVMERGGSGAPTSTIFAPKTYGKNPGTTLGAGVAKVFNPLHTQKPFYPNGKGKSGGLPGSNSLPGSGGLPGSSGSLKSLEAQYVKGVGFVNPQAAGQILGAVGPAAVKLGNAQRRLQRSKQQAVHHGRRGGDGQATGGLHGSRGPSKAYVRSFLKGPAGKDYKLGKDGFLVPKGQKSPASKLPSLGTKFTDPSGQILGYKPRLFAHPQAAGDRGGGQGAAREQGGECARRGESSHGRDSSGRAGEPDRRVVRIPPGRLAAYAPTLDQIRQHGLKDPQGKVVLHPKLAHKLIKALNARGFGNKQIAHYLTHHGTKLKTLGEPAQLVAAAQALKGVKHTGPGVPSGVPKQGPAGRQVRPHGEAHGEAEAGRQDRRAGTQGGAENPEEPPPLRHPEHADPRGLDVQPDLDLHFRGDVD